jgi:hypothetical protein
MKTAVVIMFIPPRHDSQSNSAVGQPLANVRILLVCYVGDQLKLVLYEFVMSDGLIE